MNFKIPISLFFSSCEATKLLQEKSDEMVRGNLVISNGDISLGDIIFSDGDLN